MFVVVLCVNGFAQKRDSSFYSLKTKIQADSDDTASINRLYEMLSRHRNDIPQDTLTSYCRFIFKMAKTPSTKLAKGFACISLGGNGNATGDYTQALTYLFEAEKIYSKLNLYNKLAITYNTMGNTYLGLGDIENQKKYFFKCYDIGVKHHLPERKGIGAAGIANSLHSEKKHKESNEWNFIAEKLFKEQKYKIGQAIVLQNIAENYREMNMLDQAMEYIKKAEPISLESKYNYAIFGCYTGQGLIFERQKHYQKAIDSYQKALHYVLIDKANHNIAETYKLLSGACLKDGQLEASIKYLNLHIQYKDSVFNDNSRKALLEIEKKHETEKKDNEIKLLNQENDLAKSELSKKKIIIYSSVIALILLLTLVLFAFRSNISKNRANKLLGQQKIIIEEKQKEILDSIH
ncbi:MAG: hypothetical protein JST67_11760 [Bacteroidetes bacterium]|nr:hypothetical protein [Bacteroidota bacterium]